MSSELDWIFPRLKHTSKLWKICSYGVIGAVGFVSKIIIGKDFNGKELLFDGQSCTNSVSFFISDVFLVIFLSLSLSLSTLRSLPHTLYLLNETSLYVVLLCKNVRNRVS